MRQVIITVKECFQQQAKEQSASKGFTQDWLICLASEEVWGLEQREAVAGIWLAAA